MEVVKIKSERRKDLKQKLNAEEKSVMKQISGRIGWLAGNRNNGADSTGAVDILLRSGTVAVPLLWYVNKLKRVGNSSTEAETLTLSGGVDQEIDAREVLEDKQRKVKVIVDSRGTYDTVHSTVKQFSSTDRNETEEKGDNAKRFMDIFYSFLMGPVIRRKEKNAV